MKRIFRVCGIPVFSYEEILTESDLALLESSAIDNTGGEFEFGFQADDTDDEDEWETSPDDPEGGAGFGFRSLR